MGLGSGSSLQREDTQLPTHHSASVHAFTVMPAALAFSLAAVSEIDKSFIKLGGKWGSVS